MIIRLLIRLLLLGFLGYLLYTFWRCLLAAVTRSNSDTEQEPPPHDEMMVLDPECGNYIHQRDALSRKITGKTRYFCSRECRDAFSNRHYDESTRHPKESI